MVKVGVSVSYSSQWRRPPGQTQEGGAAKRSRDSPWRLVTKEFISNCRSLTRLRLARVYLFYFQHNDVYSIGC